MPIQLGSGGEKHYTAENLWLFGTNWHKTFDMKRRYPGNAMLFIFCSYHSCTILSCNYLKVIAVVETLGREFIEIYNKEKSYRIYLFIYLKKTIINFTLQFFWNLVVAKHKLQKREVNPNPMLFIMGSKNIFDKKDHLCVCFAAQSDCDFFYQIILSFGNPKRSRSWTSWPHYDQPLWKY